MATQPQRTPRDIVEFAPNVAVPVALKYNQGRRIQTQHGERMMYSLTDGRVMFLDIEVAAQVEALGVNVGESFRVTKQTDGKKGSPITWDIARVHGEQPNGTFTVPAAAVASSNAARSHAASSAVAAAPPIPATGSGAAQTGDAAKETPRKGMASAALADEANALVDTYAAVLARALNTHEGRVKPDEVRSLLISAYIQRQKLSSVA